MHPQWRAAVPMRLLLSFRRISIATTAILSGGIPLGIAMVGMLTLSQLRAPYAAPPQFISCLTALQRDSVVQAPAWLERSLFLWISHEPIVTIHKAARSYSLTT
jgi:hypothetical protein